MNADLAFRTGYSRAHHQRGSREKPVAYLVLDNFLANKSFVEVSHGDSVLSRLIAPFNRALSPVRIHAPFKIYADDISSRLLPIRIE